MLARRSVLVVCCPRCRAFAGVTKAKHARGSSLTWWRCKDGCQHRWREPASVGSVRAAVVDG